MKTKTLALFAMTSLFAALGIPIQTFAQNNQPISASQTDPKAQAKILDQFGKLPLSFEANHGQTDARVKFLSRTSGYTLFLTGNEAVLTLRRGKAKIVGTNHTLQSSMAAPKASGVLRMKLLHANPAAKVTGTDEMPGISNYFIGNDPAKWRTDVPTYTKVKYEGIYPGVDLVYYGNHAQFEYDFVVAPGADPNRIQFKFRGAGKPRVDDKGDVVLVAADEEVRFQKPLVYQVVEGVRKPIEGSYVIAAANHIGFRLGEYDHTQPLVIDPVLSYSTYLGGTDSDYGLSIAVDGSGNAYVVGRTYSIDFPTANALQSTLAGIQNVFVTKINAAGSALVYSTYLGGNRSDQGTGIAVDALGNAYVTGSTISTNFPTANAIQPALGGNPAQNAFVTEINATGSALVYSTYLGGSGANGGSGIAVDSSGNAYVTGYSQSADFPTTAGAFQTTYAGSGDAFVTKINAAGSALVYSTYLGGNRLEFGMGIAVDALGNTYVTGRTDSTNFPTANALQSTLAGIENAFVTEINPNGSALVYSTYLGGSLDDAGEGIAVDVLGNVYVTGTAISTDFPIVNPVQANHAGSLTSCSGSTIICGNDAFIAKIASQLLVAFVQQPINADGSSVFNARRGVIPVKFTLTLNGTQTCALPPATISVTRTAGGTEGPIDETSYLSPADNGSNFRIDTTACQYIYNLAASSLGVGVYRIDININGQVVGSGSFALK